MSASSPKAPTSPASSAAAGGDFPPVTKLSVSDYRSQLAIKQAERAAAKPDAAGDPAASESSVTQPVKAASSSDMPPAKAALTGSPGSGATSEAQPAKAVPGESLRPEAMDVDLDDSHLDPELAVDYGSEGIEDDEELEDSSSELKVAAPAEGQHAASESPVSGSRRQRDVALEEGEVARPKRARSDVSSSAEATSAASGSSTPADLPAGRRAARASDPTPWMLTSTAIQKLRYSDEGAAAEPVSLFDDRPIIDDKIAGQLHLGADTAERRDYFASLYLASRYYKNARRGPQSKVSETHALAQGWNQFVSNWNANPDLYRYRLERHRTRYYEHNSTGRVVHLHNMCADAGIPCAVPRREHCPVCPQDADRLSESDVMGYTRIRVPEKVTKWRERVFPDARVTFPPPSQTLWFDDVSGKWITESRVTPDSAVGGGAVRTPSPFPERPSQGRSAAPRSRVGEAILSNDIENDADLGRRVAPGELQFARQSSELSRLQPARAQAVGGRRRTPDQPRSADPIVGRLEADHAAFREAAWKTIADQGQLISNLSSQVESARSTAADALSRAAELEKKFAKLVESVGMRPSRSAAKGSSDDDH